MCGIVGTIGFSKRAVNKALNIMESRGPDDQGVWQEADIILGHRRLSVIDLSPNGHQPMQDSSGQTVITFNGEIYNFLELRRELEKNYRFRSNTDTEVILAGYLTWGIDILLRRLRGMFAFALWDKRIQTLYMARDPFGKKPLYYSLINNKLVFASTMNAILEFYPSLPAIDNIALDQYLTYLAVPGARTIFKGIYKLLPGHFATYAQETFSSHRYWYLSYAQKLDITESEAVKEVDRLVNQAVRRRMVSDVPIGCFLSGGVDSSLVTAVMAREADRPITTLTMGFEEKAFDERPYARIVSEKYKTNYHESLLTNDMLKMIPQIIHQFGEPFADSSALPTYFVAQFAKQHVTVALNGDGGDELFAGYTRPTAEALAVPYRKILPHSLRIILGSYVHQKSRLKPRFLNGIKHVLEAGMTDARGAFVFDRCLRSLRQELYSKDFLDELGMSHPDEWYNSIWEISDGANSVDKVLFGDAMTYLPDELLPKMDVMTMAHSLEARAPLLDVDLAEFVAKLPTKLVVNGFDTKVLLKKVAAQYIPKEVLYRPKKGFNMPVASWLRTVLAAPMKELLLDKTACNRGLFNQNMVSHLIERHLNNDADFSQQLWSLFILEIWFKLYVDKSVDSFAGSIFSEVSA